MGLKSYYDCFAMFLFNLKFLVCVCVCEYRSVFVILSFRLFPRELCFKRDVYVPPILIENLCTETRL